MNLSKLQNKLQFSVGTRVRHPKRSEWGIGQIMSVDLTIITVFFESAGERKLSTDYVSLVPVEGVEAESQVLDSKFKKRSTRRAFRGAIYFNDGKNVSRKKFIESVGGTCTNWNWSWSFTNHNEKKFSSGPGKILVTVTVLSFSAALGKHVTAETNPRGQNRAKICDL